MNKLKLILSLLFLCLVYTNCNQTVYFDDEVNFTNLEVSDKAKSFGVTSYKIQRQNSENIVLQLKSVKATGMVEINTKDIEKQVITYLENSRLKTRIIVDLKKVSITLINDTGVYSLSHISEYSSALAHETAILPFNKEKQLIDILMQTYIDVFSMVGKKMPLMYVLDNDLSNTRPNGRAEDVCAAGSHLVTSTVFSLAQSIATVESMGGLVEGCNSSGGNCLGCVQTIGTDCLCAFGNYACMCTSRGCGCN